MAEKQVGPGISGHDSNFSNEIGRKERLKLKARSHKNNELWNGFRVMGLVGWSVVVPTVLGAAIGIWIDRRHPGQYSWTLMLLVFGIMLGCYNAWYWVARETEAIRKDQEKGNDNGGDS